MSKAIEEAVKEKYAAVATSSLTNESSGVQSVAEAFSPGSMTSTITRRA
jgi:hypothetical protein